MASWYYSRDGRITEGPVPQSEIPSLVAAGVLPPGSIIVAAGGDLGAAWKRHFQNLCHHRRQQLLQQLR